MQTTQEQPKTGPADQLFDSLCALFDDELERQENVLAVCRAQGDAARIHDIPTVEARTQALVHLVEDAFEAEKMRVDLLSRVVEYFELPIKKQTLSELIELATEPWRNRLKDFQTRIKTTLAETQKVVIENADYMRRSLKVVDESLREAVDGIPVLPEAYEVDGKSQRTVGRRAALIDTRG